jgi:hypothetical protein
MDRPIIFSDELPRSTIARRRRAGTLVRLAPGIYSQDTSTPAEEQVAANWAAIVAHEVPGAVIVDRSAVTGRPSDGWIFVDAGPGPALRPRRLPGLTIARRRGPGPLEGDMPLVEGLMLSSPERALADNSRPSRARSGPSATLNDDEMADWIDRLASTMGPVRLQRLRDGAEALAATTGTEQTIARVSELVGAALGSRSAKTGSGALSARQAGTPVDVRRVEMFDVVVEHLRSQAPSPLPAQPHGRRVHEPFFEAYFSNYIEGTQLTLDEAEAVMYRGQTLDREPADGHDVAATFALAADAAQANAAAGSADEFLDLLRHRHGILMAARPDKHPGDFKERGNQVGGYVFVRHDEVEGTLRAGWDRIDSLDDPYARALASMFVIAEVHPFDDGNGRVARLTMNGELSAAGEARIIVPSVYRGEYLSSLSAMSNNGRPDALSRVLGFAHRWTAQIDFSTMATAVRDLEATHAFVDGAIALEQGIKLRLISSVPAHELDIEHRSGT